MDLEIFNLENNSVGKHKLDTSNFKEINKTVVSQVVKWQLAKKRAGTVSTKNRALVKGSGKKPFKQKGTGNARAGTRTSPIWRGGGVIFGPSPKDWSYSIPKKIRKLALQNALQYKLDDGSLMVIDSFEIESPKTKDLVTKLNNFSLGKKILLINEVDNINLELSSRNLQNVKLIHPNGVNVYDLLNYSSVLISKESLNVLIERVK